MYIYIYYLQEDNEIELIIYEQGRIQDFFRGAQKNFQGGGAILAYSVWDSIILIPSQYNA